MLTYSYAAPPPTTLPPLQRLLAFSGEMQRFYQLHFMVIRTFIAVVSRGRSTLCAFARCSRTTVFRKNYYKFETGVEMVNKLKEINYS